MRPTALSGLASILAGVALVTGACGGDGNDLDALLLARERIPVEKLGVVNEFTPNPQGDAGGQWVDLAGTLGIPRARTTFFFDETFKAGPLAPPNFTRFDEIFASMPADADLLPILAYAPDWLANDPDWKTSFVNDYVIPVLTRYGADPRVAGWEIWNEPDGFCDGQNGVPAGILDCSAGDYVDLVRLVEPEIRLRSSAPVVAAATTSISQSLPDNLEFNRAMADAGLLDLVDVVNVHWYGDDFDRFALGISSYLESTGLPVWITETGVEGLNRQLGYATRAFPTFEDEISRLERIYVFTYFDNANPTNDTFGLVAASGDVSDLYEFLRDR